MNPHTSLARFEDQPLADDQLDDWLFLSYESSGSIVPEHLEVNRDTQEAEDRGKLKTKLVSAWNSVKYGWSWKQKSKFSKDSPVIMLGHSYELKDQEERELFRCSFASLLWLTYRRDFPQLADGILTTDSGWGCVLRTGQMLLAKGLLLHLMPPGWTWHVSHRAARDDMDPLVIRATDSPEHVLNSFKGPNKRGRRLSLDSHLDRSKEAWHRQVVSWFADYPTAPFGIHNLVQLGRSSGKKAGDWYGPSIVAHILRKAVAGLVDLPNLTVYVAQDCTVYLQDVKSLCERPPPQPWKSVIILVPVRLGGQNLNPSYITYVKKLLTLQCCIGIIGGKPKHSLYFVGFQDDHLLYLDPHYCQPTVDITKENFPLESFHCKHPRKMSFSRMDPSCTIGFYAKCKKDFEFLCKVVHEALSTAKETYPMFIFAEGNSQEDEEKTPTNSTTYIQRRRRSEARLVNTNNSLDEFVLL